MNKPFSLIIRCVIFSLFVIFFNASAHATGLISLPKTGQSASYASLDDGSIQAGVSWDSTRFVDNNNGTISDSMTGLVWLKNANCFVASNWNTALTLASNLSNSQCDLSDGSQSNDWRLPNQNELRSLIDYSTFGPALSLVNPFHYVQSTTYWTSTTQTPFSFKAWAVSLYSGNAELYGTAVQMPVWPVRGGVDMVMPIVTEFSLPASTTTLAVPTTISATDNVSVSAYCLTETNSAAGCSWNQQKPDTFTFGSKGNKILYVFAKDADGNISDSKSANVNILYRLTVPILGTGNGSVHSSPMTDISCIKGASAGCVGGFSNDVTLTASPDTTNSVFGGWSYACTSYQKDCVVFMDTDKTAVATFTLADKVRIGKPPYTATTAHMTLVSAFGLVLSDEHILALATEFDGPLDVTRPVIFKGGFNGDYSDNSGSYTVLKGNLAIKPGGSLYSKGLVIRNVTVTP